MAAVVMFLDLEHHVAGSCGHATHSPGQSSCGRAQLHMHAPSTLEEEDA